MHVTVTAYGSRGDVEPVVALAARLRELGAEATVCAPPDEEFVALMARAGVPHVPLGPSVRELMSAAKPDPFRLAAGLVDERFDTLAKVAEGSDAIVAAGLMPAGARTVAEQLGIRYVFASYQLYGLQKAVWQQDVARINAFYQEPLNTHLAALGLPPVDNVRDHVFTDRPWLAADPVLSPWQGVTALDVVQTGAWILPDDRPLPDGLAEFLDAGEPPVYVGFGSMHLHAAPDLGRIAVEAARAQGRRVVLARGWAELDAADDDCFVVGDVNQQALFPRVAAVVHHGGAGTTTTTARAGAPQVVVPQIGDQPQFAARVAELGIGAAHDGAAPTYESFSAALATALAPETAVRAEEVASTIRTDGTTVAAKMVLEQR
ncbi:glycosyltransferase [Kutzneria sp. CA-103260]|uniref:glycosyltransferase n=1 Tax=Kutzneria sp. CA-103260 TaxID=2802641 RepID=UPI001BA98A21|nr:glycosyltransferase [Kutzneria sp. CA-103260]QUQ67582.1 glycosyl transferase family protein [Kutzneria sp. CA-103260]